MQNVWVEAFTDAQRNTWVVALPGRLRDKWRKILKPGQGEEEAFLMRERAGAGAWVEGTPHPLQRWFTQTGHGLIDEGFAERLKRGGPKWENSANRYEKDLRQTYQGWADAASEGLKGITDKEKFAKKLLFYIDELISLLIVLADHYLPEAYDLGLGGVPSSEAGGAAVTAALIENSEYLQDSLGPAINEKLMNLMIETEIGLTQEQLADKFKTFAGRVGSYSGVAWSLLQQGFGDRVQQQEDAEGLDPETGLAGPSTKIPIRWFLDPSVVDHCETCLRFGDRTYPSYGDMLLTTGFVLPSRGTICNGNCRCSLAAWIDGDWVRNWTQLLLPTTTARLPAATGGLFTEDDWHVLFNAPIEGDSEDYGGAGSGNFGHKGIPGQRGGSAPRGAGVRMGGLSAQADALAQDMGLPPGSVEFMGTKRTSAEGRPVLAEYDRKTGKVKVYEDAPKKMKGLAPVIAHEAMHGKTEQIPTGQMAGYVKEVTGENRWKADAWRSMQDSGRDVSPFAKQQWDTQSGNKALKETLSEVARLEYLGNPVGGEWGRLYGKVKAHGIEDSSEEFGSSKSGNYGHKGRKGKRAGKEDAGH